MTAGTEQILSEALSLSPGDRAELAEKLFSSLDIPRDDIDSLLAREADSRIDAYENGEIKTVSAQQVFKEKD